VLTIKEFFRGLLFGHHYFIIDLVMIPFVLMLFICTPNILFHLKENVMPKIIIYSNRMLSPLISILITSKLLLGLSNILSIYLVVLFVFLLIFIELFRYDKKTYFYIIITCQLLSSIYWIKLFSKITMNTVFSISTDKMGKIVLSTILVATGNTIPDFFNDGSLSALG